MQAAPASRQPALPAAPPPMHRGPQSRHSTRTAGPRSATLPPPRCIQAQHAMFSTFATCSVSGMHERVKAKSIVGSATCSQWADDIVQLAMRVANHCDRGYRAGRRDLQVVKTGPFDMYPGIFDGLNITRCSS